MTAEVCPTILAQTPEEFKVALQRLWFTRRVHIDLTDGQFAPGRTISIDQVWWPGNVRVDLHVMYANPSPFLERLISLGPQLVIVHSEAGGEFQPFAEQLHHHGIEVGVALMPTTTVDAIAGALDYIDHVLIFSGNLGHYGGSANLNLLSKAGQLRRLKPQLEIGWDGGANENNIVALSNGGIDVINVGGAISQADDPHLAYVRLERILGVNHGPTNPVN
jgi:ribulose-phosphate 3-epimerase